MGQMLAGIAQGLQVHPRLVWASTAFLRENNVSPGGDMPVWIPGQGETFGFHRRAIRRAIVAGLTYRPLPITAADTLAWLHTLLPERQAKLRAGLIPGRETDLLTKLKAALGPEFEYSGGTSHVTTIWNRKIRNQGTHRRLGRRRSEA